MRSANSTIPLHRFATVAAAGLVAFLAFWQGVFSLIDYRPCALQAPNYVIPPNPQVALMEFAIALLALVILFIGAKRLNSSFHNVPVAYYLVITSLLTGQGLLAFIFLRLSTCAG